MSWLAALGLTSLLTASLLGAFDSRRGEGQLRNDRALAPLADGQTLTQVFPVGTHGLVAIELLLANYDRSPEGFLSLSLHGPLPIGTKSLGHGDALDLAPLPVLHRWHVDAASIENNRWRRFELPDAISARVDRIVETSQEHRSARDEAGAGASTLALSIVRESSGGTPVTLWASAGDSWPEARLFVDGRLQAEDLAIRLVNTEGPWRSIRRAFELAGLPTWAGLGLLLGLSIGAIGIAKRLIPKPDRR